MCIWYWRRETPKLHVLTFMFRLKWFFFSTTRSKTRHGIESLEGNFPQWHTEFQKPTTNMYKREYLEPTYLWECLLFVKCMDKWLITITCNRQVSIKMDRCMKHAGLMVSASVSETSGPGPRPRPGYCVVFLGKTLNSHSASLHPGV